MAELRVSELPTAASLDDSDLLLLSQVDENSQTGYASAKTTNVALATKVAKQTNFSDLQTTSKNIIGAINEISGAASSLVDLNDVDITTPADGECLQYNGTSQKWENKDILAVNETTLTEPYVYKQVPNGKYTEKLKKLIGASVVWNQLVDTNTTDVTITSGHKYIHWNGSTLTKATSDGTAISVVGGTDKIYDISAMFGNDTVATAITTAKFAELFPNYASYAYSANTIQSVSVSKHITKDSESQTLTETALDHTTLRGLFKLDANNNLYADGDIYNADGSGSVKYNEFDLGSKTWTRSTSYTNPFFYTSLINEEVAVLTNNGICENYTKYIPPYYVDGTYFGNNAPNNTFAIGTVNGKQIYIRDDSYTDAQTFKTAMSGKKLVYEKATPTTATLTPFNPLSTIEQGGTEEFVDYGVEQGNRDVAIPCGNESVYGDNRLMGEIIKYINN